MIPLSLRRTQDREDKRYSRDTLAVSRQAQLKSSVASISCFSLGSGADGEGQMSLHLLGYPEGRGMLNLQQTKRTKTIVLGTPPEGQV